MAAKRQRELLCTIQYMDEQELQWLDKDDVEFTDQNIPTVSVSSGTPVIAPMSWEEIQPEI